jgi:hypothetical protein
MIYVCLLFNVGNMYNKFEKIHENSPFTTPLLIMLGKAVKRLNKNKSCWNTDYL